MVAGKVSIATKFKQQQSIHTHKTNNQLRFSYWKKQIALLFIQKKKYGFDYFGWRWCNFPNILNTFHQRLACPDENLTHIDLISLRAQMP